MQRSQQLTPLKHDNIKSQPVQLDIVGLEEVNRQFQPRKRRSEDLASQYFTLAELYKGSYKGVFYQKRAETVGNCATDLWFYGDIDEEGRKVGKDTLLHMFTCKDRLCPQCNRRRSLKTIANLESAKKLLAPRYDVLFVTLTIQNPSLGGLSDGIRQLLDAWHRLMHDNRKVRSVIKGAYRTLEITFNEAEQSWHPHLHALWLVDPSTYFSKSAADYISHDELVSMWRNALGVNYDPSVRIEKPKKGEDPVIEVSKYITKESAFLHDLDALDEILFSLRGVRFVSVSGEFRRVFRELKLDSECDGDLVHITDAQKTELQKLVSHHRWDLQQYCCVFQQAMSAGDLRTLAAQLALPPALVERLVVKLFGGGSVADPRSARPPEPAEGRCSYA